MTLGTLAFAYFLGGFTFIPLVVVGFAFVAWKLLPDGGDPRRRLIDETVKLPALPTSTDQAASGTFAVLRTYNFPAANAALNARHHGGSTGGGGTGSAGGSYVEGDGEGGGSGGGGGESVYQTMYRSVFDRGKHSIGTGGSVMRNEEDTKDAANTRAKKNTVPVNVFYIVLRHGHLMLYDSPAEGEVRHVLSMAHYTVSLFEGGMSDGDDEMTDGDLFIKRTAIVLTPVDFNVGNKLDSTSAAAAAAATATRPFYFFSSTCSEKEDFYHALLSTRTRPPIPIPLDPGDTIKLQSALHSASLTQETRALNALIGRTFLALHRTNRVRELVKRKIEKKIARVQKPAFIASIDVHSIDLGDAAPVLSNLRMVELSINGDLTVALDVRYDGTVMNTNAAQQHPGGFKMTISAVAKLDLGPRFKTRTTELVLTTSLRRLQGRVLVRIKPPPSNRVWFCFESAPEMDVHVEPVIIQRQITYGFVLRQIEERIRAVVAETLVKPNWDDVPFFDTRGQSVRGGIWQQDEEGLQPEPTEAEPQPQPQQLQSLGSKHARTKSTPVLVGDSDSGSGSGSEARTSGASIVSDRARGDTLKQRSTASLPLGVQDAGDDAGSQVAKSPTPPLRSPSFPIVAATTAPLTVHDANVERVSARDGAAAAAASSSSPSRRLWRSNAPRVPSSRKDAIETMREMKDRTIASGGDDGNEMAEDVQSLHRTSASSLSDLHDESQYPTTLYESRSPQNDVYGGSLSTTRSLRPSPNRTSTTSSTSSSGQQQQQQRQQQPRKTLLAATAAATTAARNWSINALANARNASKNSDTFTHARRVSAGPMGRGQPLPPPGTPLPGPQKSMGGGIFSSGLLNVKRKPVPAPRRTGEADGTSLSSISAEDTSNRTETEESTPVAHRSVAAHTNVSDDDGEAAGFGPWRSNSGGGGSGSGLFADPSDDHDTDSFEEVNPATDLPLPPTSASAVAAAAAAAGATTTTTTAADAEEDASSTSMEETHSLPSPTPPPLPARPTSATKYISTAPELPARLRPDHNRKAHVRIHSDQSSNGHGTPSSLRSVENSVGNPDYGDGDDEDDAVVAIPAPIDDSDVGGSDANAEIEEVGDGEKDRKENHAPSVNVESLFTEDSEKKESGSASV